jgi:hypothetical protein
MAIPTGLRGNFSLTTAGVDAAAGRSPGAYALGAEESATVLTISYVGRSDTDVNARLKAHIGSYRHFQVADWLTVRGAFELECQLWHSFGTPGNTLHPARPAGARYNCPVPGCTRLFY